MGEPLDESLYDSENGQKNPDEKRNINIRHGHKHRGARLPCFQKLLDHDVSRLQHIEAESHKCDIPDDCEGLFQNREKTSRISILMWVLLLME